MILLFNFKLVAFQNVELKAPLFITKHNELSRMSNNKYMD